jgi:hypothetical protein
MAGICCLAEDAQTAISYLETVSGSSVRAMQAQNKENKKRRRLGKPYRLLCCGDSRLRKQSAH